VTASLSPGSGAGAEEQQAILDDLIAREQDRSTVVLSLMNEVRHLRRFIKKNSYQG